MDAFLSKVSRGRLVYILKGLQKPSFPDEQRLLKRYFWYLLNIFHAKKQEAFCLENTTYMRFVTFLGHESPAPKKRTYNYFVSSLFLC